MDAESAVSIAIDYFNYLYRVPSQRNVGVHGKYFKVDALRLEIAYILDMFSMRAEANAMRDADGPLWKAFCAAMPIVNRRAVFHQRRTGISADDFLERLQ